MLGKDTQTNLADLLFSMAEGERYLEVLRQVLAEQDDFEPYRAFKRLDKKDKNQLTSYDFVDFLRENTVHASEMDGYVLARLYDSDGDGEISYVDFVNAVLPKANSELRKYASSKSSSFVESQRFLGQNIEYSLTRLLVKELEAARKNEKFRQVLHGRFDFDFREAFKSIDEGQIGFITFQDLAMFLSRFTPNNIVQEEDILSILRAIDTDGDNKLNYLEFSDALTLHAPDQANAVHHSPYRKYYVDRYYNYPYLRRLYEENLYTTYPELERARKSPEKYGIRSNNLPASSFNGSPTKISAPTAFSPTRRTLTHRLTPRKLDFIEDANNGTMRSPGKKSASFVETIPTFMGESNENLVGANVRQMASVGKSASFKDDFQSPTKSLVSESTRATFTSPLKKEDETDLVTSLNEQISTDKKIEAAKCELALRSDFNMLDAFKVFDRRGIGYISAAEVNHGLKYLDIQVSDQTVYLFMRRFNKIAQGKLKYSEFCDALLPKKPEYSKMINGRTSTGRRVESGRITCFSMETERIFREVLKVQLDGESTLEALRLALTSKPSFNLHDTFDALDINREGYLTREEFGTMLRSYGMTSSTDDLTHLMDRYDKKKIGKVSYGDFVQEVIPKSPQKTKQGPVGEK